MTVKKIIFKIFQAILKRYNFEIIPSQDVYEWQKYPKIIPNYMNSVLPKGAKDYLRIDNPKLINLQSRYNNFDKQVTTPLIWTENHVKADDVLFFREDNAYVWQRRGPNMNIMAYALTFFYLKSIDNLKLLDLLEEDDYFGIHTLNIDGRLVSRDLMDSIMEIYFLEKHLKISSLKEINVLDIGAGYGRLAHRSLIALPNIKNYVCTDAVAVSTFISEYYLRFRKLGNRAKIIPLDEIENALKDISIDIAVNIHSFSECKIEAIDWWLSLLEKSNIKYLMIVPNSCDRLLISKENIDFSKIIENHGYKLITKDPKYRDPIVQRYAMMPAYHYLFKHSN